MSRILAAAREHDERGAGRRAAYADVVEFIADGAEWIWNQADLHFPGAV